MLQSQLQKKIKNKIIINKRNRGRQRNKEGKGKREKEREAERKRQKEGKGNINRTGKQEERGKEAGTAGIEDKSRIIKAKAVDCGLF